ncbi:hypothetical protein BUALT_Bualt06G0112800 [Buddleja alternifolia]|uniref:Chromo domain-containing protein n=1 Tax=Buddleja alternifolia TaxID=168488 RepID=A0AAV6XLB5_9LAMI|nr:hypothetical protein BUALT_Bualt06G0112800 [Buddleja alternifolia]
MIKANGYFNEEFSNKRVCVDLSCWMVQLQNVNKSHCPLKDKLYLKGLFHRLRALIALNCSLIFVTDGSIPAIKLSTYRRRLNAGNEDVLEAGNPRNVSSVKRNMGSEFSCMIKEAKFLGGALGIPCLDGIEEAEAQCALLNSESLCDGCFTSDSDAFLFGARTVYRDICLGEGGYVVCYEMDDIERELGFGRNSLITLAVLLGSDYTRGVRGFGPESACQIVKSIGDPTVLQRFASEGLSITKKQKNSKKKGQTLTCEYKENNADRARDLNGKKCDLPIENQFLQVINAYLKPKCHSADSDAVHRVLAHYSFSRSQLHQICARFFDWPPEKTDEYILPKIAERNLRRFANLRSSSSKLGVDLPFNEMPVKCPISSIVKTRKSQGRDYFEVSWDDMDGLESSAVPADLVESACPEKILEFQQRRAQKQKPTRKPRSKKVDKAADMKEIDRKLQELLLEIEQESTITSNAVISGRFVPEKIDDITHIVDDQRTHLNTESESENRGSSSSSCHSTASRTLETEIIDLISPPPPRVHARGVSKCQEARCIDVIELSESDNDVSPQHARKVRDLRLFIANVRNDIS